MTTRREESKTCNFRFVKRDGKWTLQQQIVVSELHDAPAHNGTGEWAIGGGGSIRTEWHDVPLVEVEPHSWDAS